MDATIVPDDWRTWPRKGNRTDAPGASPMELRLAAVWALACETCGIDPENPQPMRKDVFRIGRLRDP